MACGASGGGRIHVLSPSHPFMSGGATNGVLWRGGVRCDGDEWWWQWCRRHGGDGGGGGGVVVLKLISVAG
jgi:hypothetical protein